MDVKELKKKLKKARVPKYWYNLDGVGRDDERICLIKSGEKWVVYYSERGVHTTEEVFDSENTACNYILKSFDGMWDNARNGEIKIKW